MPVFGQGDLSSSGSYVRICRCSSQLLRVDRRRRVGHQVHGGRRLRERDHLADRALARQDRDDAVEAERDAAVRRRAVLERLEEEAEPQLAPPPC